MQNRIYARVYSADQRKDLDQQLAANAKGWAVIQITELEKRLC